MSITSIATGMEAAHWFSAKLPSTMTIVSFVTTPEQVKAIYDGLLWANGGAAIMGAVITAASKYAGIRFWWLPGASTIAVCAFLTWSYLNDLSQAPATQGTLSAKRPGITFTK